MILHKQISHCLTCVAEEINGGCRNLIVSHCDWYNDVTGLNHPRPCIHGDLTQVIPPDSFRKSDSFKDRLRKIDRAPIMLKQYCYTHGQDCSIFSTWKRPDYDLSGLPCPDHSPAGSRAGSEGVTASVFICHAKFHIGLQTPLLIIENVPDWVHNHRFHCFTSITEN